MLEFKGTPGPWKIYNGSVPSKDIGTSSVCVTFTHGLEDNSIDTANAQLIASAPELLEALQDVSEILEIFASKAGCQTQSAALKSDAEDFGALLALDRSRDIISKALGKEIITHD